MTYSSDLIPVRLYYDSEERQHYAKGGLVVKAKEVRGAGRYGDTELIHVNKEELDELRARWGEPTINPETGMPEFFLGKIGKILGKVAKIAAPIAVSFIPGIGPIASTALSAAIGAGTGALGGGGLKGALMGGLMGGLSGGAGQLLKGAGTAAQAATTAAAPLAAAAPVGVPAAAGFGVDAATQGAVNSLASAAPAAASSVAPAAAAAAKPNFWNKQFLGLPIKNKYAIPLGLGALALSGGLKSPKETPGQTAEQFFQPMLGGKGGVGGDTGFATGPSAPRNVNQRPMEEYANAGYMPEYRYFSAKGGGVDLKVNHPRQRGQSFAVGGAGTGRSDDIPAQLSDGEYVFDAETVSMLGDGSTKAGAKALDDLRVKLRQHKGAKLAKGKISAKAKRPEAYLKVRHG